MKKLLKVSERHQITLPGHALRDAGVPEGGYLAVRAEKGRIILEPVSVSTDKLGAEDWDALDRLVASQTRQGRYTEYKDARSAKKHLK